MEEQSEEDFCSSFPELSPTIEYSKNRRFSRTNTVMSEGIYKTVYLGYDHDYGREIAWSVIKVHTLKAKDQDKILEDLKNFAKLDHPNILKLIFSWEDVEKNQIIAITELTSCSLKQYARKRVKNIRLKAIKLWCKSILEGLKYLHSKGIIHKKLNTDNIFVACSDWSIRLGIVGSSSNKSEGTVYDLRSFAFCVIEMCTTIDLDYSKVLNKTLPKELMLIDNEKIREFVAACYAEETVDNLLVHEFFKKDDANDSNTLKPVKAEESFEISVEKMTNSEKLWICIKKNSELLNKYEFNFLEDVAEQAADMIVSKHTLPQRFFQEILKLIEDSMHQFSSSSQCLVNCIDILSGEPNLPNPFSLAAEIRVPKKRRLSINLGVQDSATLKKYKIEIDYNPELDSPKALAEEIVTRFQLDFNEISAISKLISEKISISESETHSNFSNQDLLDLSQESIILAKPGLNSTNEVSIPSESSSKRNSFEPIHYEYSISKSISLVEEEEKDVVCAKGHKNDPRDVKQLQEALGNILGFKVQSEGVFCGKTEQQVKILQEQVGMPQTGVVCRKLWTIIMASACSKNGTNFIIRNI